MRGWTGAAVRQILRPLRLRMTSNNLGASEHKVPRLRMPIRFAPRHAALGMTALGWAYTILFELTP